MLWLLYFFVCFFFQVDRDMYVSVGGGGGRIHVRCEGGQVQHFEILEVLTKTCIRVRRGGGGLYC